MPGIKSRLPEVSGYQTDISREWPRALGIPARRLPGDVQVHCPRVREVRIKNPVLNV